MTKKIHFILLTSFLLYDSVAYAKTDNSSPINKSLNYSVKTNGIIIHNIKISNVNSFKDMFLDGNLYGRIRSNNFYFKYDKDDIHHTSGISGSVGASFVFNSAKYNNFNFNLGLYSSQAFFDKHKFSNISNIKAAKDTFSRYKFARTGSLSLFAFAQANINYTYSKTKFTFGRQLVETFYTKSNDTKMIPNSFDGFVINSKDIKKSNIIFAYLAKQKLRDHENAHSVLMFDNSDSINFSQYKANDDGAMHKGLTYLALKSAGVSTDEPLIILDAKNRSIKNLNLAFSSYIVPKLLSEVMTEISYEQKAYNHFSITPTVRYIQQFDNGAGKIGGASLKGLTNSQKYHNPTSLNAKMIAAKITTKFDDYKLTIAYSNIFNNADLVTPWRGFPTAGYTRSMGVYNWRANTQSYRLELTKGANKKGVYTKPFIQTSILYVNSDEKKDIKEDSLVYYFGLIQNIPSITNIQYRIRLAYRDFRYGNISNYLDSRLELNYLF